jgi:hypothetical protein
MCDLWVNTLDESVPRGAIAHQIRTALATLPPARQIKLYNAGSFFDPQAIPVDDYEEIAAAVAGSIASSWSRIPRFCGVPTARRAGASGIWSAVGSKWPSASRRCTRRRWRALNKRMTLDDFAAAAQFLARHRSPCGVFVLLDPPFVPHHEAADTALSGVRTARSVGATACTVIPVRGGNGAIDALPVEQRPRLGLRELEWVLQEALAGGPEGPPLRNRMRVFADLWDIERLYDCGCSRDRAARLGRMNREQAAPPPVACACNGR